MLEWNIFVKPVVYVMELIFSAVVTIGTADRLLVPPTSIESATSFTLSRSGGLICALDTERNTLGSCISVIILGLLALVVLLYALWKRLVSAFDSDVPFANATEAQLCVLAALLWLVIASVLSSATSLSDKALRGEKIVAVVFSWLLVVLCCASATFAWLIPENEENLLVLEPEPASTPQPQLRLPQLPPTTATATAPPAPMMGGGGMGMDMGIEKSVGVGSAVDKFMDDDDDDQMMQSPRLTRKDATRVSADNPDTDTINRKLTQWERVIDGPPPADPHADALGAARFVPVASLTRAPSAPAQIGTGGPSTPSSAGLRRRLAVVQEDEITPNFALTEANNEKPGDKTN